MGASANLQIVWFKRDLRIEDHRAMARATCIGPVIPLFVAEPELWQGPDMSARQWDFVAECLTSLRDTLGALGQPLIIRMGSVIDAFEELQKKFGKITIWSHEETGNSWTFQRDIKVAEWARLNGVDWHEVKQAGVVRRLGSRDGWARRWDAFMAEPETMPPRALLPIDGVEPGKIPTAEDLGLKPDPCFGRQRGGRDAALDCLQTFLHVRGAPYRRAMSSPLEGAEHCSRLSPHLAWGVLSMREVAQATWARQRELKANGIKGGWRGSMSSFQGRLHWRDHFTQKLEDEPSLEVRNLHHAYNGLRAKEPDRERLKAWCNGETGLPFVDACMRSLQATGWINFRMRAMLMAVSSYHLWLDWRTPGEHLARQFTDYEAGIHWPQVQMQSGTTGINTVRIYNPVKQGYDQDPDGTFVRRWVPELAAVPHEFVHEPWKWEATSSILAKTYPAPIVDHLAAAREARQKVWAVRRVPAYRSTAKDIQNKHGSRKSGMPMTGRKRKQTSGSAQMALPLEGEDG
ncbi:MAG: deoxyribodipyrimidine photo-lyase [Pseudomonadota bacterium]